jgi:hypothetical protein
MSILEQQLFFRTIRPVGRTRFAIWTLITVVGAKLCLGYVEFLVFVVGNHAACNEPREGFALKADVRGIPQLPRRTLGGEPHGSRLSFGLKFVSEIARFAVALQIERIAYRRKTKPLRFLTGLGLPILSFDLGQPETALSRLPNFQIENGDKRMAWRRLLGI